MTKTIITLALCSLFLAAFIGCSKAPEASVQTKAETEISHNSEESATVSQTDDASDQMSTEETADCEHCQKDCPSSGSEKSEDVSKTENLKE